jgi:hypothetical protein
MHDIIVCVVFLYASQVYDLRINHLPAFHARQINVQCVQKHCESNSTSAILNDAIGFDLTSEQTKSVPV